MDYWVNKVFHEAIPWLEKAAKVDYAPAEYTLASCYYKATGVQQDYAKALYWYRMAAEHNEDIFT